MKSVLHLITSLEVGGAERMLVRLVLASQATDCVHSVVTLTEGGRLRPLLEEAGITVHSLGLQRGCPSLDGLLVLIRLLRRHRPQVIQTWLYHADLLGLVASRLVGYRPALAWNLRCSDMRLGRYSWLTRVLVRILAWFSPLPDKVLVNSHAGKQWHEKLGYRPQAWELVPNGIDTADFAPDAAVRHSVRAGLGLGDDVVVVGMVARRDPMKDHEGFLCAAAEVASRYPHCAFVLIGRGVDSDPALVALAAKVAAPVHFVAESSDIADWYRALDVAVLASNFGEGFPNVVAEAMACSVPAVVTAVGDSALIVGDTGLVVQSGDISGLAAAMEALAIDPQRRAMLGMAARRRIEDNFSLSFVVDRYRAIYDHLARKAV